MNSVVSDAKAFAKGDTAKELRYLDSIGKGSTSCFRFTYNQSKEQQINKGLDLEGGLNVILQISVKDVLKGLANDSKIKHSTKRLVDAKQINKEIKITLMLSFKQQMQQT